MTLATDATPRRGPGSPEPISPRRHPCRGSGRSPIRDASTERRPPSPPLRPRLGEVTHPGREHRTSLAEPTHLRPEAGDELVRGADELVAVKAIELGPRA
jgi:hypothetical protein